MHSKEKFTTYTTRHYLVSHQQLAGSVCQRNSHKSISKSSETGRIPRQRQLKI